MVRLIGSLVLTTTTVVRACWAIISGSAPNSPLSTVTAVALTPGAAAVAPITTSWALSAS